MHAQNYARAFVAASTLLFTLPLCAQTHSATSLLLPPVAPVKAVVDEYFGTKVDDPYRYMENLKDPEVEAWFKGQNDYTRTVLARIPGRAKLLARIRELDQSVPRVFSPDDCPATCTWSGNASPMKTRGRCICAAD